MPIRFTDLVTQFRTLDRASCAVAGQPLSPNLSTTAATLLTDRRFQIWSQHLEGVVKMYFQTKILSDNEPLRLPESDNALLQ